VRIHPGKENTRMSLWNPTSRKLASLNKALPKSSPRVDPSLQRSTKAPARKAPAQARPVDTFTPAPTRGPTHCWPQLNPEPVKSYSKPQRASDLPNPGKGTGVLTLNTANGAGKEYRTPENRQAQADLIHETGASIVGFQEVDVGVGRSRNVNTALDVVSRIPGNESFRVFLHPDAKDLAVDIGQPAPPTAIRTGVDGTTLYQTPEGTLVTGESFSGDDQPGGVAKDKGREASYGNAIYVAAPHQVTEAYTVSLPTKDTSNTRAPSPPSAEQLAALADGKLTDEERLQLMESNEAIRDHAGAEPRSALVTRVMGPDGREQTIINVHVATSGDPALRDEQLRYIAQIVEAESKGPPPREVVVMGDFNASTQEVDAQFEAGTDTDLERVVGGRSGGRPNYDQIWTTGGVDTQNSAQVDTEGVSDHEHAGYTVIT